MFLTPKGTTCAHLQLLPVSPSPSPWQPRICVLSLRIYLLWVFHINEIIRPVTYLSDVSPLAVCFEDVPILPSCSWLNSIPSCDGPHWFCPFIRRGMLFSAFRLLWLALLGIFRDKFLFEYLLWVLSGRLGLLGAIVALCLPFWAVVKVAHSGGAILRSRQLWMRAPFLSHPCQRLLVSSSSTFFFFFDYRHPSGCEVVWDCGFPACFPNDHWLSGILACACWPFRGFFWRHVHSRSLSIFLTELFVILLSSCRCLCAFWMPDPYPLYIICKYFSHSIGCLSPFLILSFDAQKSLMAFGGNWA